jgi:hypothetical protein
MKVNEPPAIEENKIKTCSSTFQSVMSYLLKRILIVFLIFMIVIRVLYDQDNHISEDYGTV